MTWHTPSLLKIRYQNIHTAIGLHPMQGVRWDAACVACAHLDNLLSHHDLPPAGIVCAKPNGAGRMDSVILLTLQMRRCLQQLRCGSVHHQLFINLDVGEKLRLGGVA